MATVLPGCASATVPLRSWAATLVMTGRVVVTTTGAVVSSTSTTVLLLPMLPAASVFRATRLWLPSPNRVTVVDQVPSPSTVALPSAVAEPLS